METKNSPSMLALTNHIQSIRQEASTVRINRAQCLLVARRLQHVFHTLSNIPNAVPTPQMLSLFSSADLLIQRMKYTGWKHILRYHFTCSSFFAAIFERIPKVWQLHSTALWGEEIRKAIATDEIENAKVYLQLLTMDPDMLTPFICQKNKGDSTDINIPTEEQVISILRRYQLSGWKVSFEDLTPPIDDKNGNIIKSKNIHLVFDTYYGYLYKGIRVVLQQLEEINPRSLTPGTLTGFVQDMVTRLRWCHPNIIPFIGAFTEKALPLVSSNNNSNISVGSLTNNNTTSSSSVVMHALALGIITVDVKCLKAQAVQSRDPTIPSSYYYLRHIKNDSEKEKNKGYRSLEELLFIERHRFSLIEAIGIILQIADALHYILMDEEHVPAEVAKAWITLSPSHIFVCPISLPPPTQSQKTKLKSKSPRWEREGVVWDENIDVGEGEAAAATLFSSSSSSSSSSSASFTRSHSFFSSSYCSSNSNSSSNSNDNEMRSSPLQLHPSHRRCVHIPITCGIAVMFTPQIFIESGPFSRWQSHPHALSPVSYILIQLFIAILTNKPPYRNFRRQVDLAARIFLPAVAEIEEYISDNEYKYDDDDDDIPDIKVTIPPGSGIPPGLPIELRKLCQRGLLLQNPRTQQTQQQQTRKGISLEELRRTLQEMFYNPAFLTQSTEITKMFEEKEKEREHLECYSLSVQDSSLPQREGHLEEVEMMPTSPFVDDYGELSSNTL